MVQNLNCNLFVYCLGVQKHLERIQVLGTRAAVPATEGISDRVERLSDRVKLKNETSQNLQQRWVKLENETFSNLQQSQVQLENETSQSMQQKCNHAFHHQKKKILLPFFYLLTPFCGVPAMVGFTGSVAQGPHRRSVRFVRARCVRPAAEVS